MDSPSTITAVYCQYAFAGEDRPGRLAAREDLDGGDAAVAMTPLQFNRRLRTLAPARGNRFPGDLHDTCMVIERSKNLNLVLYTANLVDGDSGRAIESGKGRLAVINAKDPLRTYWLKLEPEHVTRRRLRGETDDVCELNYIEKKLAYGCYAARAPASKVVSELTSALKKTGTPLTSEEVRVVGEWDAYFAPCVVKYVAAPQLSVLMLTLPPIDGAEGADECAADMGAVVSPGDAQESSGARKDVGGDSFSAPGFSPADTVTVMLAVIDGKLSLLKKVYVTSIEPKHFYQLPSVESLEVFGVSVATSDDSYERRMLK